MNTRTINEIEKIPWISYLAQEITTAYKKTNGDILITQNYKEIIGKEDESLEEKLIRPVALETNTPQITLTEETSNNRVIINNAQAKGFQDFIKLNHEGYLTITTKPEIFYPPLKALKEEQKKEPWKEYIITEEELMIISYLIPRKIRKRYVEEKDKIRYLQGIIIGKILTDKIIYGFLEPMFQTNAEYLIREENTTPLRIITAPILIQQDEFLKDLILRQGTGIPEYRDLMKDEILRGMTTYYLEKEKSAEKIIERIINKGEKITGQEKTGIIIGEESLKWAKNIYLGAMIER